MKKQVVFIFVVTIFLLIFVAGCQNAEEENDPLVGYEDALGETATENILLETESASSNVAQSEEQKIYNLEDYGTVEEKRQEYFWEETGELVYYYTMEEFFVNDTFANASAINLALQQIYDECEKVYEENAEYAGPRDPEELPPPYDDTPYDYLHILNLTYVGEDYISIQYNDISYMGGAHPYSLFDGITIDLGNGEPVSAPQLLGKGDEEILAEISNTMGLDDIATWEDVDFYLTDSTIVFFYRTPGFWEDVVLPRE